MQKTKFLKQSFSAVLAVVLIFASFSVGSFFSASAATQRGIITSGKYDYYSANRQVCERLAQGIKNFDEKIDIRDYNVSADNVASLYFATLNNYPELFYADYKISYSYRDDTVLYIKPSYNCTKSEAEQKTAQFDARVEELLGKLDDSMTDFQKALILHDEIILSSEYSGEVTAYDLLVDGKGCCTAYSRSYSYLLALVGINSEIVESAEMNHAWNKIEIDGEYYNVDVTWDDPTADRFGKAWHGYFLYSDSAFVSGNNGKTTAHTGFEDALNDAASTKYDDYGLLHRIDAGYCYVNGTLYCVDNQSGSQYEKCLLKYNASDDTAEVIHKFDAYWMAAEHSYWIGGFSSLDSYEKILYCNTDNEIYYYDVENSTLEKYNTSISLNGKCYGLLVKDEKVYAVIADNPNVTGELVLAGDCIKKEPAVIKGDVDGDGKVTIFDATLLQKNIAGVVELNSNQLRAADANGDGKINVLDVTYIQKTVAYFT